LVENENIIKKLEQYLEYFKDKNISISIEGESSRLLSYDNPVFYKDDTSIIVDSVKKDNKFEVELSSIKNCTKDVCGGLQAVLIILNDNTYIQIYNK
jgi:DNA-directed RNA polymerase specialized sigma subunit